MVDWADMVKQALESGDEIQKSYTASYNGQSGYLVMSNQKLVFVSEKGFFKKNYNIDLEVTYDKVDEIRRDRNRLTLVEGTNIYELTSAYASAVEKSLKDLK